MPSWVAWIPIVVLVLLVPFAFWVRWQIRKINREEGPIGLQKNEDLPLNKRRP
jgi:hypothetical protein